MNKYYFIKMASESGGQVIAIYHEKYRENAFNYIINSPITFLSMWEADWSGLGELPAQLKFIGDKKSLFVNKMEKVCEPQTLLHKIDSCFLEEDYDSVTINPQDYQEFFIKNMCKIQHRYEPEIHIDLLKEGIMGYLTTINGKKQIKISRVVESGKIIVNKQI